jgi:hypothetical protein
VAAFQRIIEHDPCGGRISSEHLGAVQGAKNGGHKGKAASAIALKVVGHHIVGI